MKIDRLQMPGHEAASIKPVRCAIYNTQVSTDMGSIRFNSLDAQ